MNVTTACTFPAPWEINPEQQVNKTKIETDDTVHNKLESSSNISLDSYVGEYMHPGLGIFKVFKEHPLKLRCEFGILLRGDLNYSNETGVFFLVLDPPLDYNMVYWELPEGFPIYFVLSSESRVEGVHIPYLEFSLPPFFERVYT